MAQSLRRFIFIAVISIGCITLIGRFFYLQVYQWDKYMGRSERNRIRQITSTAPRGLIRDRDGKILVDNRPSYSVSVLPYYMQQSDSSYKMLSLCLDVAPDFLKRLVETKKQGLFQPVKIREDVAFKTVVELEERKMDLPGIVVSMEPRRIYPAGIKSSHQFGYVGEISKSELEVLNVAEYKSGDQIGKKGIEKQYEYELRGRRGISFVEVDALGREIEVIHGKGEQHPLAGRDIYLTIDADLQRTAEECFKDKRGASIFLDCRNGEILSIVSKPDFDLELFSGPIRTEEWRSLVNDPTRPLYDRALQSLYPPGSTFKLVLAAAAIETGACDVNLRNNCVGYVRLGWRTFNCWKHEGHGDLDMLGALMHSCNSYFYKLSLKVDISTWAEFARRFGFGRPVGIDIPGEVSGVVPDPDYLDRRYGKGRWSKGMNFNLAVGQGDLLVTPLQMVQLAMMIANRGRYYTPHLVREIDRQNAPYPSIIQKPLKHVEGVSLATFDVLREGMYKVVNEDGGTGIGCRIETMKVAGKTGTAQNPHGDDHAWFIGFAPYENPELAFCVFVENGGTGGGVAAPLAKKILRKYRDTWRTDSQVVAMNSNKNKLQ